MTDDLAGQILTVADVIRALRVVAERWDDLEESRIHGTPRPPTPGAQMSALAKAEMDRRHIAEKIDADDRAPGYSAAPLRLDVLDTMANLLMDADLLHEGVAQILGHPRLDHPASAYADARPYLAYVMELLPEACQANPDALGHAWDKADAMRSLMLMALGEIFDGQRLSAICPFCVGRTTAKLAGELTMRVRIRETPTHDNPDACEFVIACENPDRLCQPFAKEVDVWLNGHPAWRYPRWRWLADRLHPKHAA
jgi:hypothetical protein